MSTYDTHGFLSLREDDSEQRDALLAAVDCERCDCDCHDCVCVCDYNVDIDDGQSS